ncbi:MAG: hypothetical protein IJP37_06985 [Clostridia bacterium]|nr:hypothetical protein [Clostridia bacterium]
MRKTRLLAEQLEQRNAEVDFLNRQISELNALLDEYRGKEQAIAMALTEAQTTAARLVRDARVQVQEIYDEADRLKVVAEDEAASITEAAAEKAAKIVEDAEAEARRRVAEAAEKASECERASASFRQELERAAEEARVQAERFQMYLSGRVPEAEETAMEGRGLSALIQDPPADMPEEYENPSALMHSIYKLQNREIPVEEAEEAAEYVEERVWTVDEIVAEQGEGGEEAVLADADLDSIIDDVLGE